MNNVNMVEYLVELQKEKGINVYLTEEGLRVFLELMKQDQPTAAQVKVG